MVMMAGILPVAILFCGFVIDVANWFEHDRHLQTQADAAALAGGLSFLSCPNNTPITDKVNEYSGQTWNSQVGGTQGSVHVLLNSRTYYNQPSRSDPSVVTGQPCAAKMVDVKATETDLPWWFSLGNVDFLNAHARVEFKKIDTLSGATPLGVPDINPTKARVWFVDEDKLPTDALRVLGTRELTRKSYTNGMALWDNTESPISVTVDRPNIGVRVAISYGSSTTCGDPLVVCYDMTPNDGILYARGWSDDAASQTAPKARDVRLFPDGSAACPDAYFSSAAAACTIGVQAAIDFGGGTGYQVTATAAGVSRNLTLGANGLWRTASNSPLSVAAVAVKENVTLAWRKSGQTGSFGTVQRTFGASSSRSGPIKLAQIWEGGVFGANSFHRCTAVFSGCQHNLVVKLGLEGTFADRYADLASVTTPVTLRFDSSGTGSQNQSLDCDPWADPLQGGGGGRNFTNEIARGCRPSYTPNEGTACPSDPTDIWGTSSSPENQGDPWECSAVEVGGRVSQLGEGFDLRILGTSNPTSCPASRQNKWPNLTIGDPRIIHVFLTQFGAFDASGRNTVPVTGFASFYVTGWRGVGAANKNPCQKSSLASPDDPVPTQGTVVGHFIQYTGPISGTPGEESCDFSAPTPCVSILTQ